MLVIITRPTVSTWALVTLLLVTFKHACTRMYLLSYAGDKHASHLEQRRLPDCQSQEAYGVDELTKNQTPVWAGCYPRLRTPNNGLRYDCLKAW